jgi:hypothetical protein
MLLNFKSYTLTKRNVLAKLKLLKMLRYFL